MRRTAQPLPRETRDTFFMLAVIAWVILPHLGHLPVWCVLLAVALLGWRGWLAWHQAPLPSRWWLAGLMLLSLGATIWTHGSLLGMASGVTMVVVLLALKTLEMRARRDAFVVFFLGFFAVMTNFLFSQSLLVALAMLVAVLGLLTALVLAHMPVGAPSLGRALGLAGRMAALGLPIMVVLFLLFPRIGPLWGLPADAMGRTGLSEEMRIGDVAHLARDERVALRVRFPEGVRPDPSQLYFRGPVLSRFDGVQWRVAWADFFPPALRPPSDIRTEGPGLPYELTLQPTRSRILPLLELTPRLDLPEGTQADMRPDLHWRTTQPISQSLRVTAQAWPRFSHGPREPVVGLQSEIDLPPGFNPRTLEYAAELRRDPRFREADARALADHLLQQVATGGYTYTLSPGTYGRNAIDEFWFDRRQGFCEHFAAAFVVMMRALDIPARVVTGYQGAEYNPYDGYYVVRHSHAHAWAEYWQAGVGWVRADPTAAVAPDRILANQALEVPRGAVRSALDAFDPDLWRMMRDRWEAINNQWTQWVLSYSQDQQFDLLRKLGVRSPSWHELSLLLIGMLVAGSLAGAIWSLLDRVRQDPWRRQDRRLRRQLARLGLDPHGHLTPRELAMQAHARLTPALGPEVARALLALDQARYSRQADAARAATLARDLVRRLRWVPTPPRPQGRS